MISDWSRAWRARALLRPPVMGVPEDEAGPEGESEWVRRHHVRTDLAIEAREVVVEREGPPEIPGVKVSREEVEGGSITRVDIESDIGSRIMGKVKGKYVTIEMPSLREHNPPLHEKTATLLGTEIRRFLNAWQLPPDAPVLLVGLGNWNATPDALGPKVIAHCLITRHLFRYAPPPARDGLRPVAGVAPGVLGLTGMETSEIIQALVERFRPALVVCIDALAARTVERLGTTVQISDAGIAPGSGVGNRRRGITRDELGVPVLVIGVPTVIGAITIISDAWDRLLGRRSPQADLRPPGQLPGPGEASKEETLKTLLGPYLGTMIVTPKEVDALIDDLAAVLAAGINVGLHPGFTLEDAFATLQ